jgi:hypothetical protein
MAKRSNIKSIPSGIAGAPDPEKITPAMISAGVRILTTEFGGPTENPLIDLPAVARRVFAAMLGRRRLVSGNR